MLTLLAMPVSLFAIIVLINVVRKKFPNTQARKRFNCIVNIIGVSLIILMAWSAQRNFNQRRVKAIQAVATPNHSSVSALGGD
jgi:ABC-type nickel/cobalt efflux system permease component RcnA